MNLNPLKTYIRVYLLLILTVCCFKNGLSQTQGVIPKTLQVSTQDEELLLVIAVDGSLQALSKETGQSMWTSQLNLPMIGSFEFENQTINDDIFVPLIDGSLIRFDKEGYLEKTHYNVKEQDFPNFYNKNQCIVTGQTRTTALQLDLQTGKIIQTVGSDLTSFQGFNKTNYQKQFKDLGQCSHQFELEPLWLIVKNYDYLSYDHENGLTQWSIFYSEISQTLDANQQPSQIVSSYSESQSNQHIYVRGNLIYSIYNDESGERTQQWSHISETPIFQVLSINKQTNAVESIPFNKYTEKESTNIKLVFVGGYIYADHSYKFLPEVQSTALQHKHSDWPAKNLEKFDEWTVPIKELPGQTLRSYRMLSEQRKSRNSSQNEQKIMNNTKQPEEKESEEEKQIEFTFLQMLIRWEFILLIIAIGLIQWGIFKYRYSKNSQPSKKNQKKDKKDKNKAKELKNRLQANSMIQQINTDPNFVQQLQQQTQALEWKRKIIIDDQKVLGLGSGGTVVFQGILDGREIAVKRMLLQHNKLAQKEIQFLQKVDLHPNLITYYDKEEDKDFVYLAIEKCEGNLEHLVELMRAVKKNEEWKDLPLGSIYLSNPKELNSPVFIIGTMQQSLRGVKFLHDNSIVHRDIKPHNILVNKIKIAKLSDMGLSKQLHEDQLSYHTEIKGSLGWQPPEVIQSEKENLPKSKTQKTQKVDIFSLGCVFYYLLSRGSHPFGQRFEREKNILFGKYSLNGIEFELVAERVKEAQNLIEHMIQSDPKKRPSAADLLNHIFFWSNDKKLKLIQELSDKLEFNNNQNSELILKLETIGAKHQVLRQCNNNWPTVLHQSLLMELQKWRKYNQKSFTDLLRFVRNKKNHYRELTDDAKELLGTSNDSYLRYFALNFPSMMLAVDEFVKRNLMDDPLFSQYYEQ